MHTHFLDAFQRPQEQEPVPIQPVESPPKDNEAYCEKICANVYDENDEIVCGSDGYMYTGESQLECYSSCLNIGKHVETSLSQFIYIIFSFIFFQRCR